MIIKRKLRVFDGDDALESLFSDPERAGAVDQIYGNPNPKSRRIMLEVMKVIEMYYAFPDDTRNLRHWIDKAVDAVITVINYGYFPPQAIFSPIDWKDGNEILGRNIISSIKNKYRDPENFITEFVMGMLLTEKNAGEIKYGNIIKTRAGIKTSPKDYLLYYKYIALCLSGQMNPKIQDLYSNIGLINKTDIDYKQDMNYDRVKVTGIITQCMVNIMGYVAPSLYRYID